MSHPESDGVAEMLEGGHRALLTGVQRWLELVDRRQTDRAGIAARIAQRAAEHDLAHRRAVEAVASTAHTQRGSIDNDDAIRNVIWENSTHDAWERAELVEALTQDPTRIWDVDGAVDTPARILSDWKVDQTHHASDGAANPDVFDDRYYRTWPVMEATDAQLDLAEKRAAAALAQAPVGADRSPAAFRRRLLDGLGDIIAADAHTAFQHAAGERDAVAARRIAQAPTDLAAADRIEQTDDEAQELQLQQEHDSHEFRMARAEQLEAEHFDPDITEAAMINDLSFGTPASQPATAAQPPRRPAKTGRTANRGNIRQRSTFGRRPRPSPAAERAGPRWPVLSGRRPCSGGRQTRRGRCRLRSNAAPTTDRRFNAVNGPPRGQRSCRKHLTPERWSRWPGSR